MIPGAALIMPSTPSGDGQISHPLECYNQWDSHVFTVRLVCFKVVQLALFALWGVFMFALCFCERNWLYACCKYAVWLYMFKLVPCPQSDPRFASRQLQLACAPCVQEKQWWKSDGRVDLASLTQNSNQLLLKCFPPVCLLSPKGSGDGRDFRTRLAAALRSLADEMDKGTHEVRPSQMKRDFIMNRLPPSCQPELLSPCKCLHESCFVFLRISAH